MGPQPYRLSRLLIPVEQPRVQICRDSHLSQSSLVFSTGLWSDLALDYSLREKFSVHRDFLNLVQE